MSLAGKLDLLASSQFLEQVNVRELVNPEGYKLSSIKSVRTRYGEALVCNVELPGGVSKSVFLPSRFAKVLDESDLKEMNESGKYRVRCTDASKKSPDIKVWKEE